jgi:hypothetical protein
VSGSTLADGRRAALEFLDIDDAEIHGRFVVLMAARGALPLLQRLPSEATRGGICAGRCLTARRARASGVPPRRHGAGLIRFTVPDDKGRTV